MKCYPELSLHRPEPTSMSQLTGFNRVQVGKFFELLRYELSTKKYTAAQIYNVDESGIMTVQDPGRIIAKKGSKQVGRVVSAERRSTTTVVCVGNLIYKFAYLLTCLFSLLLLCAMAYGCVYFVRRC